MGTVPREHGQTLMNPFCFRAGLLICGVMSKGRGSECKCWWGAPVAQAVSHLGLGAAQPRPGPSPGTRLHVRMFAGSMVGWAGREPLLPAPRLCATGCSSGMWVCDHTY